MTTADNLTSSQRNQAALRTLKREYPAFNWSCSVHDDYDPDEIMVTFLRYSDDAEDRYVIRDGKAELI